MDKWIITLKKCNAAKMNIQYLEKGQKSHQKNTQKQPASFFKKKVSHILTVQDECRSDKDKKPEVGTVALVRAYSNTLSDLEPSLMDQSVWPCKPSDTAKFGYWIGQLFWHLTIQTKHTVTVLQLDVYRGAVLI
jgi:hypothetical protein